LHSDPTATEHVSHAKPIFPVLQLCVSPRSEQPCLRTTTWPRTPLSSGERTSEWTRQLDPPVLCRGPVLGPGLLKIPGLLGRQHTAVLRSDSWP